jgi:hypothetical protein
MSSSRAAARALHAADFGTSEAADLVAAFGRVEDDIRAVAVRDRLPVRLDVTRVVVTVLGAVPKLQGMRPQLEKLSGFDLVRFGKLADFALALAYAHAAYESVSGTADDIPALGRRGTTPPARMAAAEVRTRAFTVLMNAYDETRRAVTYLRWHEGDADHMVPPVLRGHRSRRTA